MVINTRYCCLLRSTWSLSEKKKMSVMVEIDGYVSLYEDFLAEAVGVFVTPYASDDSCYVDHLQ